MIESSDFIKVCVQKGFTLFTGTPCSYLKPFINYVIDEPKLDFIEVTNEGDAVAVASGAWLGGRKSVVMFQNSGLGNAINPITSLSHTMRIPFLGIVTLRGEPEGAPDEPQHELMGEITCQLLQTMKIPYAFFPTETEDIEGAFGHAFEVMEKDRSPFFFVMRKGSVKEYQLKSATTKKNLKKHCGTIERFGDESLQISRTQALECINEFLAPTTPLIATTGKTGRELFDLSDSSRNFYMVGSMGCALPIGFGLALTSKEKPICVIDGDGALLMRLGNMPLVGQLGQPNLIHILLDNGCHDSTGGQRTYSEYVDFAKVAEASGYKKIYEVFGEENLIKALSQVNGKEGPYFLRVSTMPGSPKGLGRPTVKPMDVSKRFKEYLESR